MVKTRQKNMKKRRESAKMWREENKYAREVERKGQVSYLVFLKIRM